MSVVIEGEASETDEEDSFSTAEPQTSKKIVHVDEKVQKYWRHLAIDTQTVLWRRTQTAVKSVSEQKELTHKSFQSIQNAASSLRTAFVNLRKIQEGLKDIQEAADLLPSQFESSIETIKIG